MFFRVAPRCPTCQQPISKDKITNDTDLQKEIQNLDVYCTNKEKGCSWDGTLRDLTSHQENCGYNAIECSNGCGAKFERRFMDKHLNEDCAKRTIECEFCKKMCCRFFSDLLSFSCKVINGSYSKKKFPILISVQNLKFPVRIIVQVTNSLGHN